MALDLVDGRHDRGALEEGGEVLDHEVAHPDRADVAAGEQGLEGAVGLQGPVKRRGQRLVEDQEVDLVDAELAGALLEAVPRLVVAVIGDPDLGLQEDLGPVRAGAMDCLADPAFVAVGRCGVDEPVARGVCRARGVPGIRWLVLRDYRSGRRSVRVWAEARRDRSECRDEPRDRGT